jgi:8-oxo-dGTP pyrophosphatase MutT (NUDIX family)
MEKVALAEINILGKPENVFQRRDGNAPTSPHRLAWFGGHIDIDDKTPFDAILRELGEETSLDVRNQVIFGNRTVHEVPAKYSSSKELVVVHLFRTMILATDVNFEVNEGSGAEYYTNEELLQRNDVASIVRFILEHPEESQII